MIWIKNWNFLILLIKIILEKPKDSSSSSNYCPKSNRNYDLSNQDDSPNTLLDDVCNNLENHYLSYNLYNHIL